MLEKTKLRKKMLEQLQILPKEKRLSYSQVIYLTLFSQPEWKNANVIGVTISTRNEINTKPIIEKAWKEGKKVVVPKCNSGNNSLDFRRIDSFDEVAKGYYSLEEPIMAVTTPYCKESIDFLIVPGVVFDKTGIRIGFGGGYYDRYLSDYKGNTTSLAYELQIIEKIPNEQHDIPVGTIISEISTYNCSTL